jgi:hypothetical protein
MIRPSVLWFALLITAPALYRYVFDEVDITAVLLRFLIAVPIAAVLLAGLRFVTGGYGDKAEPATPVTPTPADSRDVGKSS